jgi:thymidylate kinase
MDLNKISYIVEGTDGVGKSTIIKELMERYPALKYHHFMHPYGESNRDKYCYQWGQFVMMFKFIEMSVGTTQYIFDRAHIGEYIWGPEYRKMFPDYMPLLEDIYADLPVVIIHVDCDTHEIQHRLAERKDEKVPTLETIQFRRDVFRIYCNRSPLPTFYVDTTGVNDPTRRIDSLIKEIESYG